MKKIIFLFFSQLLFVSNASAEWSYIGRWKGDDMYIHWGTVSINNRIARFSVLSDIKSDQSSMIGMQEFDCQRQMWRLIYARGYDKPMLQGKITGEMKNNDASWSPIATDGAIYSIRSKICNARP